MNTRYFFLIVTLGLLFAFYWCLPRPLFDTPYAKVVESQDGKLLSAKIATDGQWRFPPIDTVPERFSTCLIAFEDRRFYDHWGVDFWALGRAIRQNIRAGEVVSGASTITMQVMRLAGKQPPRTIWRKLLEIFQAWRLEWRASKSEILALYASHAPFGGNVVGVEAAAWRYYGKQPDLLSWSEAATLAVLPNSPSLIRPGKNRALLREKRDRVLAHLLATQRLDSLDWQLAREEPLPGAPYPLPQLASHVLERNDLPDLRIKTTLNRELQNQVLTIADWHHEQLVQNSIHNLAILVIETKTGYVRAYCGNAPNAGFEHGESVDIIVAPRSTGSILKPLLVASALDAGVVLPNSWLPDFPTTIGGFHPANFNKQHDGVVPLRKALVRSLNIPFVYLLRDHGIPQFHRLLKDIGLTTLSHGPDHYGLSLILGGAETTLWDITGAYASLGRTLLTFQNENGYYRSSDWHLPQLRYSNEAPSTLMDRPVHLSATSIYTALEQMSALKRPDERGDWRQFGSSKKIAWKTGTSYGFRDAWAVGVTPDYTVGVWVGNADGEGRNGLFGVQSAAPVLFDVFDALPGSGWFLPPVDEQQTVEVCAVSGWRPNPFCPTDTATVFRSVGSSRTCTYHQLFFTDPSGKYRMPPQCLPETPKTRHVGLFLPPREDFYYRQRNADTEVVPPIHPQCADVEKAAMQLIFPQEPTRIFIPRELDGSQGKVIFQVAHRHASAKLFWHIDAEFVAVTESQHKIEINPQKGRHQLVVVDEEGNRLEESFQIIE